MPDVNVFSIVHHPIMVSYPKGETTGQGRRVRGIAKILPGRNKVDEEVWDRIKPFLKPRLDKGFIRASSDLRGDLTRQEKIGLMSHPGEGWIRELSAKADHISDGKIPGSDADFELVGAK